jgi:hypothetical protein
MDWRPVLFSAGEKERGEKRKVGRWICRAAGGLGRCGMDGGRKRVGRAGKDRRPVFGLRKGGKGGKMI